MKLTEIQKKALSENKDFQCGLTGWFSRYIADVPEEFKKLFKWDCKYHDVSFRRGGGIIDFIKCNFSLLWRTNATLLVFLIRGNPPVVNRIFKSISLFMMLIPTFIFVFTIGIFAFDWGKKKSIDEVLGLNDE